MKFEFLQQIVENFNAFVYFSYSLRRKRCFHYIWNIRNSPISGRGKSIFNFSKYPIFTNILIIPNFIIYTTIIFISNPIPKCSSLQTLISNVNFFNPNFLSKVLLFPASSPRNVNLLTIGKSSVCPLC